MGTNGIEVLASGAWPEGFVVTGYDPAARRKTDVRVESVIAERWAQATSEAASHGKLLFAGPQCRLVRHECLGGRLRLALGPTDYREFLGTNLQWRRIHELVGEQELAAYLANALAVCAAVHTADGRLVIGKRSQRVMEHPGRWHVPGGNVDPDSHVRAGVVDVFCAARAEIHEELGCAEDRVSLTCLGLIRPLDSLKPELLFLADVRHTGAELLGLANDSEHDELLCLPDAPAEILAFLEKEKRAFAPSGKAALARYLGFQYGIDWHALVEASA